MREPKYWPSSGAPIPFRELDSYRLQAIVSGLIPHDPKHGQDYEMCRIYAAFLLKERGQ